MLGAVVAEFPVHLVGEQVQVVLQDQVAQRGHLVPAVEVARGVSRIADQDALGARGDQLFEVGDGRQGEAGVDRAAHGHHLHPRGHREAVVVGIERFGHDQLIALVEAGHHAEEQRLRAAGGHHHLLGGEVDAMASVVVGQSLSVAREPGRVAVLHHAEVVVADGLQGHVGGGDVRLADVQVQHLDATCLGGLGIGHQFADRRFGHAVPLVGDGGHGWFVAGCEVRASGPCMERKRPPRRTAFPQCVGDRISCPSPRGPWGCSPSPARWAWWGRPPRCP